MATPTNLPAAVATGDVGTAAQFNNLRGAFRILQVVSATTSTSDSSTSSTYANTSLSASITPQSSTSKILVILHHSGFVSSSGTSLGVRLTRDQPTAPTVLQTQADAVYSANGGALSGTVTFMYLDSPASTSALTYRTQFARNVGGGTVTLQVNNNPANITLLEVSA